jgi:RimJ/RimL family protein N-acetyltransferase
MARSTEEVAARIRSTPTQAVFGAFESEVLIGITGIRREPLCQVNHKATIWGVFVSPSYRGRRIAQALLSAATAHAAEEWDVIQLMLCVNAENLSAKRLYASCGFQTFGLELRAMKVGDRFYDEEHMCNSWSSAPCRARPGSADSVEKLFLRDAGPVREKVGLSDRPASRS